LIEGAGQSPLIPWHDFYVIVGSSGAALTGLQFVVIAILADSQRRSSLREVEAFGTPTVVHFIGVLLVSGILSAPWQQLSNVALALEACGVVGVIYALRIVRSARRVVLYDPVFTDWLWFVIVPIAAYAVLLISAILLPKHPERSLFMIAAVSLSLLLLGIRNAWDSVTYLAIGEANMPVDQPAEAPDAEEIQVTETSNHHQQPPKRP
jgi:hypothetical protein